MFTALQNVVPSHLMDGARYDFKGLQATGVVDDHGDKAFDPPVFPAFPAFTAGTDMAGMAGMGTLTLRVE
jgi:tRNA 2-thiocytidine biosynthesis protein TtcA